MAGVGPRTWAGAAAWLVQPLYLLAELVVAGRSTAPYSLLDNTISDLGATACTAVAYPYGPVEVCSPWHPLLNAALVVSGGLMALGAVLLRPVLPPGRVVTASVWLWVVSGLGGVGAGLVPLDVDLELHAVVALPTFVAQPLALLLLAAALRREHGAPATASALAGSACAVGVVAFFARTGTAELSGALERLALWPAYLTLPVVAWAALGRARTGPDR